MSKLPTFINTLNATTSSKSSQKRLFVPTLGSYEAFAFWFGLVFFLSLYGILVQFDHITSLQHFGLLFFDFFLVQFLVVFSIIGYTHLSIASYQPLTIFQQSKRIALTTLILAPIATLLGKFIEIALGFQELVAQNIFIEAAVNTGLGLILVSLLLYYFGWQYAKILSSQQRYHQKLLNQNAQLKARITPHFFFNMLNTLQYLSETDPAKSNELLQSISKLYRVSFYEPKEIGVNEEIDLCEHYLAVEQYRFGDKLQLEWDLPDEDLLYDMSIPSLMIQMSLEKLILAMVETTTKTIHLTIQVTWQDDWAAIQLTARPARTLMTSGDVHSNIAVQASERAETMDTLDFESQRVILHQFYGKDATIDLRLDTTTATKIVDIKYPFKDIAL